MQTKFATALILLMFMGFLSTAQTISGRIIYDPNNNESFDGRDFGMPAIKVYLYEDKNNNNQIDANEKVDSAVTNAYGEYDFGLKGSLRYTYTISSSNDDANEYPNGSMDRNDSKFRILRDGSDCLKGGLRFTNFNAPIDSISYAQIRFKAKDSRDGRGTEVNIYGEKVQNAMSFSSSNYDITNRTTTTKSVQWGLPNTTDNDYFYSANLTSVIKEVMLANNWSAGTKSLSFIFTDPGCNANSPYITADSRDKSSSDQPRLEIYTPTGKRYFVLVAPNELGQTASTNISSITINPYTNNSSANFYVVGKAPICYAFGDNGGSSDPDDLIAYNRNTGTSVLIKSNVSTSNNIEAMAFNANSTRIFAMDGNRLSKYEFLTGEEIYRGNAIGSINYRNAARTSTLSKTISDCDGMTMDENGNYWVADVSGGNVLFKIDSMGNVFPNQFGTGIAGMEIIIPTLLSSAGSTKLDDLAFNPVNGKLYASYTGGNTEYIVEIILTGSQTGTAINPVSFGTTTTSWTDLEGLAMTNDGFLTGTTGQNANNSSQNNHGLVFNLETLKLETAVKISASKDFESCNCFTRNTQPMSALTISGQLFDDANGLTDNIINGTGFRNPSNVQMFAYLVDAVGNIVSKDTIKTNGSYSLKRAQQDNFYMVKLSSSKFNVGQLFTGEPSLPNDWVATGDSYGANNAQGTGNEAGNPDLSVITITENSNITGVNFGINMRPTTDDYQFNISSPGLNSLKTLIAPNLDTLSGADFEDGIKGQNSSFKITSISGLNGNTLFYDANNNGIINTGELLTAGSTITNYQANKLKILFTGLNSTSLSFTYASIDAGGLEDLTPATYSMTWTTPVPVVMLYFNAEKIEKTTLLSWATASEENNSHFDVLRSEDTKHWEKIGEVVGNGTTQQRQQYSFIDYLPMKSNYYRLKQVDYDGQSELTQIKHVIFEGTQQTVHAYPNPVIDKLTVSLNKTDRRHLTTFEVIDLTGRSIMTFDPILSNGAVISTSLDLSILPKGLYMLRVITGNDLQLIKINKL